jgi:hypothetical protein
MNNEFESTRIGVNISLPTAIMQARILCSIVVVSGGARTPSAVRDLREYSIPDG